MTPDDRLLMLVGKAVHAAFWHDENGDCDNPYDCGASVQEEAAAAAVIALVRSQPRFGHVSGPIYESGSDDDLDLDGCVHDWFDRGTPGDRWQECFLCGATRDTTNHAVRSDVGPTACGCFVGSCDEVGAPGCYFGEVKR